MSRPGFILRFVDVVLILLFGFISIASIDQSDLEPPESTETERMLPDQEELIFVSVTRDGEFLVEEETVSLTSTTDLRQYLEERIDAYGDAPVKVKLRSSWDAPIQHLIAAANVCDQIGVQKAVEVKLRGSS